MKSQAKVKKFCNEHNLLASAEHRTLDLTSEVGELAKEVLKMSDYGRKKPEYRKELKDEIGDVYFALLALANELGTDLEEALELALRKYEKRLVKGGAGSENE